MIKKKKSVLDFYVRGYSSGWRYIIQSFKYLPFSLSAVLEQKRVEKEEEEEEEEG